MKINISINIEKRHFVFLVILVSVLFVVGVGAYGGNQPSKMGHSSDEIENLSASKVLPGTFNGTYTDWFTFPGNLKINNNLNLSGNITFENKAQITATQGLIINSTNVTIQANLTLGGTSRDSWPTINSLSSLYVGECIAPVGGTCKCNAGEKFMFMTGNSAGNVGYCAVGNQGTIDVTASCDWQSVTGSHFACFK